MGGREKTVSGQGEDEQGQGGGGKDHVLAMARKLPDYTNTYNGFMCFMIYCILTVYRILVPF